MRTSSLAFFLPLLCSLTVQAQTVFVPAARETENLFSASTPAGGVAIYRHGSDPALSRIVATERFASLLLAYDLAGTEVSRLNLLNPGDIDVQEGVEYQGETLTVGVVLSTGTNQLNLFRILANGQLASLSTRSVGLPGFSGQHLAVMRSPTTGKVFAFVSGEGTTASLRQLELATAEDGKVEIRQVRELTEVGAVRGLVADDAQAGVFAVLADGRIVRFEGEPEADNASSAVFTPAEEDPEPPFFQGLSLYAPVQNKGYLLVADSANDVFWIFDRKAPHALRGTLGLSAGAEIDAVTGSRLLAVENRSLGEAFPSGLLVVQDSQGAENENFKLAAWQDVAGAFAPPLLVDTSAGLTPDGGSPDGGGGGSGTGLPFGGGSTDPSPSTSCACSSGGALLGLGFWALGAWAWAARRKRS